MWNTIKRLLCKHQLETEWVVRKYFGVPYMEVHSPVKKCKKCGKVISVERT